jgi:hypothetical protein
MSRTTPRRLLCKGERSRGNAPAFFIERRRSIVPSQAGLVCWFGKWPCKPECFYTQPEAKVRGSQQVRKKSSQGWLGFCFSRLGLLYPSGRRDN